MASVTLAVARHHHPLASVKLYFSAVEAHLFKQLVQSHHVKWKGGTVLQ